MLERRIGHAAFRQSLLLLLSCYLASVAGAEVTENFDDQSDSPPFTHADAVDVAEGGGPFVTWSYPDLGDGNYAYRIVADASASSGSSGASRGGSYDASPPVYTNFVVHFDLLSWVAPASGAFYGGGVGRQAGPGTTDAYALYYEPTFGTIALYRVDDEIGTSLASTSISLSTAEDYRLVVARSGTTLVGRVYERPDLTTPIVTLTGTAATNWTDLEAGPSVISTSHTEVADATFDNFRASDGSEDFDGDGLTDLAELVTHGSSPYSTDTDGDGMEDAFEVANGFDPADGDEDMNGTVDGQDDEDSDGLGNAAEALAGTDPNDDDTDDDGLLDGAEIGTGSFGGQQVISSLTDAAASVFAADVDGDGDTDVLSASQNDDKVAWYENTDGLGGFGAQQVISTLADGVVAVFAADVDGDGDADVLSASFFDDVVAWYENTDGAGGFGGQQVISDFAGFGAFSVIAADVDGDGDKDVVSANFTDSEIAWYENTDGLGGFGGQQLISTLADGAASVFAVDVDGDGDTDVLSASANDDEIAWYENTDGAGGFGGQQVISTLADAAVSVFAADVDGDGDTDVLSASSADDEIAWYENTDGAGGFGAQQVISTLANGATSVFAADVDGDGHTDVLAASEQDDTLAWYENTDGQGSFGTEQLIYNLSNGVNSVVVADVDGDGDLDAVSASNVDDEIAWFEQLNVADPLDPDSDDDGLLDGFEVTYGFDPLDSDEDSNGTVDGQDDEDSDGLGNAAEQLAGTDPNDDDTDDDGLLDGAEIGTGSFGSEQPISSSVDGARWVTAADLDGDGDLDVLAVGEQDDTVAWYENTDGAGTFGSEQVISTSGDWPSNVVAADVDGDGDKDVMVASFNDSEVAWYENTDGAGTFASRPLLPTTGVFTWSVYAADIDGDRDLDAFVASHSSGEISWHENTDGDGTWGSEQLISNLTPLVRPVIGADLDGDGDVDALTASEGDDRIAWYENTDGLGTFGSQQTITTLADGAHSVDATDIDGDGDLDVIAGSFNDDEVAWYENTDGLGTFGGQQVISTTADILATVVGADIDGDGDQDALVASYGDDELVWHENTDGAGSFGGEQLISSAGDGAIVAAAFDLDGDGDLDVLLGSYNDDTVAWYPQLNVSDPLDADTDDDGSLDGAEIANGTDPYDSDSDDDGLSDGDEAILSADPLDPDSDNDGVCDGGLAVGGTCTVGPDTCTLVSDPGQTNSDSLSAGDACQCGDVSDDGVVDATDYLKARQHVVGATITGDFDVTRCNLVGPEDAGVTDCDAADLAVLDRQVNGLPMSQANQAACDAWGAP